MRELLDRVTFGRRRRYRALMRRLEQLDRFDAAEWSSRQAGQPGSHARDYGPRPLGGRPFSRRPGLSRLLGWPLLGMAAFAAIGAFVWPSLQDRLSLGSYSDRVIRHQTTAGRVAELTELPPMPADVSPTPLGTPAPAPTGEGTYRFFFTQKGSAEPVTYDPCRPIHFVIRWDNAPEQGKALIEESLAAVTKLTGLQFVYEGETGELPSMDRQPLQRDRYGNRWAPVLLAWSDEKQTPALAGSVAGMGGSTYVEPQPGAPLRYVTGQVVLDGPDIAGILDQHRNGFQQAKAIIMHEIAHLVGLEHVDDPDELMHPRNTGRATFGIGDRQGLHLLGRGDCHTDT